MSRKLSNLVVAANYSRPNSGLSFVPEPSPFNGSFTGSTAWQSNGGPHRGHPARSLPFSMEIKVDPEIGHLVRLHILGVFALYSGPEEEAVGTLGASIHAIHAKEPVFRQDLLNGRHYRDARNLTPLEAVNGDGTSLQTVGVCEIGDAPARVDLLAIDIPAGLAFDSIRFMDLNSPASFVVFDVLLEYEPVKGCPFHADSGGISLGEIGSSIRIGDRHKFTKALEQMESALSETEDLDEVRGEALTFLAVVTAATIEIGGSREMHRTLLEGAREFDSIDSAEGIKEAAIRRVEQVVSVVFQDIQSPSSYLVDRALAMVERNYAKNLTDAGVAAMLGLSTSHFRYLFRQVTGQPFHKFLVALRLEKARQLLMEDEIAISAVAKAVGFTGLSHFSRAFAQRFQISPTSIRRSIE